MARPGIMVYFDMMGPLRVLSDEDKGRLFWAMLEYGQSGKVPQFEGVALALAWEFVKPKLDKDSQEYNKTVLKRQYATFCRDRKKKGELEISFEEWLKTIDYQNPSMMTDDNQNHHMIPHDTTWHPTTTTPTTTSTTTATAAAATTNTTDDEAAATATENKVDVIGGKLGKGVVFLSDAQIADLLDRMGIDTFDYYVDKLSNFIIQNGAKVKNHYETILKWWQEDSAVHGQMNRRG